MHFIHLIVHTTAYRKGNAEFKLVAETMQRELACSYPEDEVRLRAIKTKKELLQIFEQIKEEGNQLIAFHFVGHSGIYGPMFGTVEYPEQFSPYELKQLSIPFAKGAKAYFHCCRSARWFAPFFARSFAVDSYGYHLYTGFTRRKDRFQRYRSGDTSLYAIGCIGKKSHGYLGSFRKYFGFSVLEEMKCFPAEDTEVDTTYNEVAVLYDAVFQDIKVRKHEWKWINEHFPKADSLNMVEIGCGNGALLKELSPRISKGIGLDISENLLERARVLNQGNQNTEFRLIEGPKLPVESASTDLVISMLSFRYLDWDPIMDELKRILKPGGKVLIIDMVTAPVKLSEYPRFLMNKLLQQFQKAQHKEFRQQLNRLVSHPAWKKMLHYNPIRSEHEMKWYLESRFPGQKAEIINIGYHSRILAFDSGNIDEIKDIQLSYP